ncbi:signal peptidase I [Clavibacter michiganensis]|uniref:signal peptidase I n=1 Tax=Clavibacter michiganensis TaxID=28447 RepID=UPI000CE88A5A|nr:signal peptidase I [Clavibacter michiganensis]MDO4107361.1 signal peptidase I [Clavibacter michiganensis]PPF91150.1 signal peptidase I [Clavibacter michiganensis]PPF91711.1 signal peptidase I [Clavibacter michiganensis]
MIRDRAARTAEPAPTDTAPTAAPTLRSPARRALGVLGGLVTAAVGLAVIAVVALSALGVTRFVPVLSNSMAPGMPVGSLAITAPTPRGEVAEGDVVVFTAPSGPRVRVIHRVTHVFGPEDAERLDGWSDDRLAIQTKGDNNPSGDPWIVTIGDDAVWERTSVVPFLGWPFVWLGDPITRAIAFAVVGATGTIWLLTVIWRRPPRTTGGPA